MNVENSTGFPADDGLGRIIFERKGTKAELRMPLITLGLLIPFTLLLIDIVTNRLRIILCSLVAGIAAICIVSFLNNRCKSFRGCERGVFHRTLLGSRTVRFKELDSLTYSAQRVIDHHNRYLGTRIHLVFDPTPASGLRPIKYKMTLDMEDEELVRLRNRAATSMATRWEKQFQANQSVDWTANLKFLPDGIQYIAQGFVGKKAPVVIPYELIDGHNIDDGKFYVWSRGQERPVIEESVGRKNFFPGYVLFQSIVG